MNMRTTVILAIIAAVAAVAIILAVRAPEAVKPALGASVRLFKDLQPFEVTRIEIDRSGKLGKVAVELKDGRWRMVAPLETPADTYQAGDLARQLADITIGKPLVLNAQNLKEYGLEPPAATVKFTAAGQTYELAVGQEVGLGLEKSTPVRVPGAKEAYLVKGQLYALVTDEVAAFRAKGLIDLIGQEVTAFKLTRGQETIAAEQAGNKWTLTQPVRTRGEAEAIVKLITAAGSLMANTFVADNPKDLARYELDKPRMVIELQMRPRIPPKPGKTPETEPQKESLPEKLQTMTISIGGYEDLQKTKTYAKVSGIPSVVTLLEAKVRELDKDLFTLRDKSAVEINPATVERLALDIDGSAVTVEKQGPGWQIVAPEKAPADNEQISSLLSQLASLKVKQFVDHADLKAPAYGLDKPYGSVTFRSLGAAKDSTVTIGNNKKAAEMWFLDAGTTTVGRVDAADVMPLKQSWLDLRKRIIWKLGAEEKIRTISWVRDGETVTVAAEPSGGALKWKMTSPVTEDLDTPKVTRLVDAVSTVTARKFLAPVAKAADFGLDKPAITLTVTTGQPGAAEKDLAVHKLLMAQNKDKYVALAEGGELIFEIDKDIAAGLENPMWAGSWFQFDKERVNRLEIKGSGLDIAFNRSGEEWNVENQPEFHVDAMRVRRFCDDLADIDLANSKVVRYAAKDLAAFGLDKPAWRIHVKGLADDKTLLISDKGPGTDRYATIAGTGRIVSLSPEQVTRLVKDKSYFRGEAGE
jgi:hypothetical protein